MYGLGGNFGGESDTEMCKDGFCIVYDSANIKDSSTRLWKVLSFGYASFAFLCNGKGFFVRGNNYKSKLGITDESEVKTMILSPFYSNKRVLCASESIYSDQAFVMAENGDLWSQGEFHDGCRGKAKSEKTQKFLQKIPPIRSIVCSVWNSFFLCQNGSIFVKNPNSK